jgi:peptide/nickel transport system ATP-binding protein
MPTLEGTRGAIRAEGSMPSASDVPPGCPFHTRCPRFLGEQCATQAPPWRHTAEGHAYRCWIPPHELALLQAEVWDAPPEAPNTAAHATTARSK